MRPILFITCFGAAVPSLGDGHARPVDGPAKVGTGVLHEKPGPQGESRQATWVLRCTQNAQDYAGHSEWPDLANRLGFRLTAPADRAVATRCLQTVGASEVSHIGRETAAEPCPTTRGTVVSSLS